MLEGFFMFRKTYVEVNLKNIHHNVSTILQKYHNYQYYIGMVKANAYGHGYGIVQTLTDAGINYLAVSSLDEAVQIRKDYQIIPILCTEIIDIGLVPTAIDYKVTLTVDSLAYLKVIGSLNCKVHIKLDTGMNRMGVKTKEEFFEMYQYIMAHENIQLEGIYTHFGTTGIHDKEYDNQIKRFQDITSDIDLSKIPMVHLSSSFSMVAHPKIPFENAVRIGTMLYGYDVSLEEYGTSLKEKALKIRDTILIKKDHISPVIRGNHLPLKPAMTVKTNVMEIRSVKKGDIIGYGLERVQRDMRIAILPIGYDDGIGTDMHNRFGLIGTKKYPFVGNACMCMSFMEVDDAVELYDEVVIMGESLTLGYMSRLKHETIQQTLVSIGKGLERVYIS